MTMDRSNTPTLGEILRMAIEQRMADLHTAIPAQVETYDASTQKVSVKPLIKRGYLDESGARAVESLPVIAEVPVVFPGAGGFRVTFPIAKGDVVLLVFSEASIDRWLVRGGEVDPADDRRHTLTDAIALPGLRPFSAPLSSAPTDSMTAGQDGGPVIEFTGSEIRAGGSASLATKSDIDALAEWISSDMVIVTPSGNSTPGTVDAAPSASGTTILKGS